PAAHLLRQPGADPLEAALAGRGAVPVPQPEDRHLPRPGRRHRRRTADRGPGRDRRPPPDRLLFRPDDPALVRPGDGSRAGAALHPRRQPGRPRRDCEARGAGMRAAALRGLGWLLLALVLAGIVLWWIGTGGAFDAQTAWIAFPILVAVAAAWAALRALSPV